MYCYRYIFFLVLTYSPFKANAWGFFAHKQINEKAVFTLPIEMIVFYKKNLPFIKENAVTPDKRRYVVEGEAARHYIDMEYYGKNPALYWQEAVACHTKQHLSIHGILPWHIYRMMQWLTKAFENKNKVQILRFSTEIGHYAADAHVPLHTTENYNGQLTQQHGIHGLWESRLPELFSSEYNLFAGKPYYITNPQTLIWEVIKNTHKLVPLVLTIEKDLDANFPSYKKYCFEKRGTTVQKMYARAYAKAYHQALNNMVEMQMRASIHMIASIWYTCWVNAGQPDLTLLAKEPLDKNTLTEKISKPIKKLLGVRTCEH